MREAYNLSYVAPRRHEQITRHIVMHLEGKLWLADKKNAELTEKIKELNIELSKLKRTKPIDDVEKSR
jgi:hypothetical protein